MYLSNLVLVLGIRGLCESVKGLEQQQIKLYFSPTPSAHTQHTNSNTHSHPESSVISSSSAMAMERAAMREGATAGHS